MTDIINSLRISFHRGSCREVAHVVATIARDEDCTIALTDVTPFHPRDFVWPDQPADKGTILTPAGKEHTIADAVIVAVSPDGEYYVEREIPVKKRTPGWNFGVGHVIRGATAPVAGDQVVLAVDECFRREVSRAHSAAHLMALALDRALSQLWRKQPGLDALGAPDFDTLAMETSKIGALRCSDTYRLGKTLRKLGFSADALAETLAEKEREVNATLAAWLAESSPITIEADGEELLSRRYFCAVIEGKRVKMPCGGTHVASFAEIGGVRVRFEMPEVATFTVETTVNV